MQRIGFPQLPMYAPQTHHQSPVVMRSYWRIDIFGVGKLDLPECRSFGPDYS